MKKTAIVVIAILCMVLAIGLTACNTSGQLATPANVAISGNTLSWDEVKNASGYIVTLDGETTVETDNTFYTYKAEAYGKHTMSVVAKGEGNFTNSAPSSVFEFYVTDVLETPVITYTVSGSKLTYTWNEISGAKEYMLKIGLDINAVEPIRVEGTSYEIDRNDDSFNDIGIYTATVYAVSNDPNYRNSVESNRITFINSEEIVAPANFKIDNGTFKWDKSENATKYRLTAMEQVDGAWKEVATKETTSQSMSYDRFGITKDGTYKVTIVAFNEYNDKVYTDSKLVKPEDEAFATLPEFTILPKVANFSLVGNTLSWDKVESSMGYSITATTVSGSQTEIINVEDKATISIDLSAEKAFKDSGSAYKTYTFSIIAKGDKSKNIYESDSVKIEDGSYYSYHSVEGDITEESERKAMFPKKVTPEKSEDPAYYEVNNFPQLMWALENAGTTKIVLTSNISMKDTEFVSPVVGAFKGSIDGKGHIISKIKITNAIKRDSMSIFDIIDTGAVVENLVLSDIDAEAKGDIVGGVLARVNKGTIRNVVVDASIAGFADNDLACIVYDNAKGGVIEDTFALGTVSGRRVAGIAVVNNGKIAHSTSYARVSGFTTDKLTEDTVAGGIVAVNNGAIDNVISMSAVSVNPVELEGSTVERRGIAGGVVGVNNANATITNSYFTSSVSILSEGRAQSYIGGFVGVNKGDITLSYVDSESKITRYATKSYAGGFAGYNSGNINNAFSSITITKSSSANKNIAGFVGHNVAGGNIKNIVFYTGVAGEAELFATNEGTIDLATSKGLNAKEMGNNSADAEIVKILGAGFKVYANDKAPKLAGNIYVSGADLYPVNSATGKWTSDRTLAKYQFNGENKTMTSDVTINSYSGYQIIRYEDGDVYLTRLVKVK